MIWTSLAVVVLLHVAAVALALGLVLGAATGIGWPDFRRRAADPAASARKPQARPASARLFVTTAGNQGETVVFLPGLGGTTRYWRSRVEPLASSHRLVLVDLLGFGRSPKPFVRYTVERHLDALHAVLDDLGTFTLVGHSLGAVLSVAYAARHPERVERLVLLSLPYFGSEQAAIRHFRSGKSAEQWLMTNAVLTAITCVLTRRVFGRLLPRLLPDMPREVAEDLVQHTWRSSTSSLWQAIYRHDLARDAAALRPALRVDCIHGDQDATAPLGGLRQLSRGRPGWRVTVLPGVDHHPLLRDPGGCLHVIRRALRRPPGGSPSGTLDTGSHVRLCSPSAKSKRGVRKRIETAAIVITAILVATSMGNAQQQPKPCLADSTGAVRDTTTVRLQARRPAAGQQSSAVPRNLVPLLRESGYLAGSFEYPMIFEAAYPNGPLIWRRSSRPMYTQRAGLADSTGWLQTFPRSSRWVFVAGVVRSPQCLDQTNSQRPAAAEPSPRRVRSLFQISPRRRRASRRPGGRPAPRPCRSGSRHSGEDEGAQPSTVLIVEDNFDNRIIYRTILEHSGFLVIEAADGESGVRLTREDHPNLILMDISIPVIDGHEATRILKADPVTASIPVVALTAHVMAEDRIRAAEAGCDGYLAKPAEPKEVVAEVRRLLAEHAL